MKKTKHLLLMPLLLVCGMAAGQNMFMKISGIPGETQDQARRDWIQLTGYKHEFSAAKGSSGSARAAAGKVTFKDFTIRKKVDKATPILMQKCASGEFIPQVELEITTAEGKSSYRVVLSDVIISGIESASECAPKCETTEHVSFNYSKITWEHTDSKGSPVKSGYDLKMNKRM